jgi:PAS fold.
LEKGEVKNVAQPFSPHSDFLDQVAPEDQAMVSQEMDENTLRALIELGSEKSFETRLRKEDGTYFWAYIIIQGIVPSRAQPANYMVFMRSVDEQKQKEAHAKALLQNAVDQAEMANKSKSEFLAL